ncbi:MAG TPA: ribose-phosphate pyrophosphokinase [Prolixibacteraceae bacterium]|nr:ribose-phosphate pyrophosphokinase [Prolixibacteraceae bacterium]
MPRKAPLKVFTGTATSYLTEQICKYLNIEMGKSSCPRFSDGEFEPSYEETIRGSYVFIVQSTFPSTDNLWELLLMIDAAKRASAYKVIAVIPYFGYARQDRKDKPRVSIGAKVAADVLSIAGVDRVIVVDLHADQIQGFFNVPVDHLYASSLFVPYIKDLKLPNLVIASPDVGGTKRANTYAKLLKTDMVICHKTRSKANVVDDMTVIGDVVGKDVILVDDIIDTAGTITKAADLLMAKGASSVRAFATHPVLSGPAYERIENSKLQEVYFTDTIPLHKQSDKIKIISLAPLLADVIDKVYYYKSISTFYIQ